MALCGPLQLTAKHTLKVLGKDADAVRPEDRDAWLIDLGIGVGRVRMCVRTENARLVEALAVDTDDPLAVVTAAFALLMEVQPHRVMLSPAGRLEVYQPVPAPDGDSPLGAHTHLLPKLVRLKRPCSALDPIPEGWQPFLTLHPAAPFRPSDDDSHDYDRLADLSFLPLLEIRHGGRPAGFRHIPGPCSSTWNTGKSENTRYKTWSRAHAYRTASHGSLGSRRHGAICACRHDQERYGLRLIP